MFVSVLNRRQMRDVEGHAVRRVAHVISCRDGDVVLLWVGAI